MYHAKRTVSALRHNARRRGKEEDTRGLTIKEFRRIRRRSRFVTKIKRRGPYKSRVHEDSVPCLPTRLSTNKIRKKKTRQIFTRIKTALLEERAFGRARQCVAHPSRLTPYLFTRSIFVIRVESALPSRRPSTTRDAGSVFRLNTTTVT